MDDHGGGPDVDELQWSHVFSDMVSHRGDGGRRPAPGASMEPCLFRHGKGIIQEKIGETAPASMEPCLFRHGKVDHYHVIYTPEVCFNGAMSFQTW